MTDESPELSTMEHLRQETRTLLNSGEPGDKGIHDREACVRFGAALKAWRTDRHQEPQRLATEMGISVQTIYRWERTANPPTRGSLLRLLAVLNKGEGEQPVADQLGGVVNLTLNPGIELVVAVIGGAVVEMGSTEGGMTFRLRGV